MKISNIKDHCIATMCLAISTGLMSMAVVAAPPSILFEENFDNSDFASRGWFDNVNVAIDTSEHIANSIASAQYTYNQGAQTAPSGGSMRMSFTETDEIYISYYVKYSANWEGSNRDYHPHEFFILTNLDSAYSGLSDTHLTAYIEQIEGVPVIALQDSQNIDENNIGVDLTNVTENRAVAGCNGVGGAAAEPNVEDCWVYSGPSDHRNGAVWRADQVYFSDQAGPTYKNDWHHVEAYLKMNTISNARGNYDGIAQYWYDGQLIMDYRNVLFRTGQHPNMRFDTLAIAPYIGDGSPVTQTMWVDNLVVATSRTDGTIRPLPPTDVTVQ